MNALEHLGEVSREYQRVADAYRDVAIAAAISEAEHKAARAKAVLRSKSTSRQQLERCRMRYNPLWRQKLRSAASHPRGQVHDIAFVTASALRDRGLGTLWWSYGEARLTISKAGREQLVEWDHTHPEAIGVAR